VSCFGLGYHNNLVVILDSVDTQEGGGGAEMIGWIFKVETGQSGLLLLIMMIGVSFSYRSGYSVLAKGVAFWRWQQ
jgi:hypothetical protein